MLVRDTGKQTDVGLPPSFSLEGYFFGEDTGFFVEYVQVGGFENF